MNYKMYDEMMEQPDSLRRTFASEMSKMDSVSEAVSKADKIYLIGCGSSISTCYSVRDALRMSCDMSVEVFTGYEFYYNKKLTDGENSIAIFTSQSGVLPVRRQRIHFSTLTTIHFTLVILTAPH